MSSQSHLQILTPWQNIYPENFSCFPALPVEIRLRIWHFALQRQRLIRVNLRPLPDLRALNIESLYKRPFNLASIEGYHVLSKFLRINRESREVALRFYRVSFPCTFEKRGEREHGIFHFNPEHDFLHIVHQDHVKDGLISFLHQLKTTYDPEHVGLLNLAMSQDAINDRYFPRSSDLEPEVRKAFIETITQLHEVFFLSTPPPRLSVLGPLSEFQTSGTAFERSFPVTAIPPAFARLPPPRPSILPPPSRLPTSETYFNRSLPIMAIPPTFQRLPRDPRPIVEDLGKVLTGMADSRKMLQTCWNC